MNNNRINNSLGSVEPFNDNKEIPPETTPVSRSLAVSSSTVQQITAIGSQLKDPNVPSSLPLLSSSLQSPPDQQDQKVHSTSFQLTLSMEYVEKYRITAQLEPMPTNILANKTKQVSPVSTTDPQKAGQVASQVLPSSSNVSVQVRREYSSSETSSSETEEVQKEDNDVLLMTQIHMLGENTDLKLTKKEGMEFGFEAPSSEASSSKNMTISEQEKDVYVELLNKIKQHVESKQRPVCRLVNNQEVFYSELTRRLFCGPYGQAILSQYPKVKQKYERLYHGLIHIEFGIPLKMHKWIEKNKKQWDKEWDKHLGYMEKQFKNDPLKVYYLEKSKDVYILSSETKKEDPNVLEATPATPSARRILNYTKKEVYACFDTPSKKDWPKISPLLESPICKIEDKTVVSLADYQVIVAVMKLPPDSTKV